MKMQQPETREEDRELYIIFGMQPPQDSGVHKAGEYRQGDICPRCSTGCLDYDGLLNLSCPECGYAQAGCFT